MKGIDKSRFGMPKSFKHAATDIGELSQNQSK